MPPTVLLDACVLYPAPLRDLLMWSATTGVISVRWSERIFAEWVENLLVNRPEVKRERLERTCAEMNRAVPDAMVAGYESLIEQFALPDPNDRHVVAAAVTGEAEVILTLNLKDFPADRLPEGIVALAPNQFLTQMFDRDETALLQTMTAHRTSLLKPPKTAQVYVETVRHGGLTELAQRVCERLDQI